MYISVSIHTYLYTAMHLFAPLVVFDHFVDRPGTIDHLSTSRGGGGGGMLAL